MANSTETKELKRVSELWFEDADVIFQAGRKLFRVHRSILSARSPVFRDMFSVPPPIHEAGTSTEETLDGCTLIQLPDSEDDVLPFFLAIFDSSYFDSPPLEVSMDVVISILRLAHKYDVKFLSRRAIAHLNPVFPTEMVTFYYPSGTTTNEPRNDAMKLSLFEVMEVAFKADVSWILPSAFLWTVELKLSTILKSDQWNYLSPDLQEGYIINRERYIQARERAMDWLHVLPSKDGCSSPARCAEMKQWYVDRSQELVDTSGKILFFPPGSPRRHRLELTFCSRCASDAAKLSEQAVKKLWDNCPKYLGLHGWDMLIKEKADFMAS
ncbi:hypothetical protein GALMADRAFT_897068 [Galerina marginata CBS 339.88]|uniref:BTB domain-containing protein n=1 Tax=Galerina marginata (strain CBS 339.88) TaxID=685588 RepID=A0A067SIV7_GALM3|nr:hypothetical protein GALMADRAFT_897068 [Galerina marginata CBS 339.88]